MTIPALQADLVANLEAVKTELSPLASSADVAAHLRNTLWPFIENLVAELAEVDGVVDELYHASEDVLSYETGVMFGGVIAGGMLLVADYKKMIAGDAAKLKAVNEWERLAKEAAETLEEITLPEADDEGEEDGDEEGEEGEDEDGEEGEGDKPGKVAP